MVYKYHHCLTEGIVSPGLFDLRLVYWVSTQRRVGIEPVGIVDPGVSNSLNGRRVGIQSSDTLHVVWVEPSVVREQGP